MNTKDLMHRLAAGIPTSRAKTPYFRRLPPEGLPLVEPKAITLSDDQQKVFDAVRDWSDRPGKLRTFGGYAGTGKTTVLAALAKAWAHKDVAFCAFTGKASNVLSRKLHETGASSSRHTCGTIHSLIYEAEEDVKTGKILSWKRRNNIGADLIVIDEASMVNASMLQDLQSYKVPILAVGDHGQLPPVQGESTLMRSPDLVLEKIHRQAEGSPIIRLSRDVRETGDLPDNLPESPFVGTVNEDTMLERLYELHEQGETDVAILTYTNRARQEFNAQARALRELDPETPAPGDRMVCLKNVEGTIFNGMVGQIHGAVRDNGYWWDATVDFPDAELSVEGSFLKSQIGRPKTYTSWEEITDDCGLQVGSWKQVGLLFDYGYALTCHKFQGSQAKHVFLNYERGSYMTADDWRRWLYTGVTRATEYLYIVV